MTLTNNQGMKLGTVLAEVPETALAEPGTNEVEAITLTDADWDDNPDWEYAEAAEDNGTAGNLDGQDGLVYDGPKGGYARVKITNVDTLEHATTAPEAADTAALSVFVNSEAQAHGDEGFNTHDAEIAVENNLDTIVGPLSPGDVLRVGFSFSGEEADADLDVSPGEIMVT